jgi:hypothetical protein
VRLLARAEARGIRILNCPEYVRRWIAAEKERAREPLGLRTARPFCLEFDESRKGQIDEVLQLSPGFDPRDRGMGLRLGGWAGANPMRPQRVRMRSSRSANRPSTS